MATVTALWAYREGSSRPLVKGDAFPDFDPTSDEDMAELGRKIRKEHGVARGGLRMEVRGGPRSRRVVV